MTKWLGGWLSKSYLRQSTATLHLRRGLVVLLSRQWLRRPINAELCLLEHREEKRGSKRGTGLLLFFDPCTFLNLKKDPKRKPATLSLEKDQGKSLRWILLFRQACSLWRVRQSLIVGVFTWSIWNPFSAESEEKRIRWVPLSAAWFECQRIFQRHGLIKNVPKRLRLMKKTMISKKKSKGKILFRSDRPMSWSCGLWKRRAICPATTSKVCGPNVELSSTVVCVLCEQVSVLWG